MNRSDFFAMVKDVHKHPERLAEYRKTYKNVYPFSDGIFKMLMANEAKPKRTVKFLNAMLMLSGTNAIKTFSLGVPENPGVLDDKSAIFDIYGITEASNPVLIEVQQNFNAIYRQAYLLHIPSCFAYGQKVKGLQPATHLCTFTVNREPISTRAQHLSSPCTARAQPPPVLRKIGHLSY